MPNGEPGEGKDQPPNRNEYGKPYNGDLGYGKRQEVAVVELQEEIVACCHAKRSVRCAAANEAKRRVNWWYPPNQEFNMAAKAVASKPARRLVEKSLSRAQVVWECSVGVQTGWSVH
ncbi:hypothetical protein JG687_00001981 [Phytophthora cactorum]|uniref:Uncharacterized protein n=1 Tax=Phytophthora cactorum TaxID=29920 RepID=A0A329SEG7_9STRA|nr:hypothetical protein Pcac1_g2265 [Phytophthora cactorum]KAG2834245.1 hypothetical protein PC112_g6175 [Phytophthora cactorum]KAG2862946.1 hypothetical protein PC113_g5817 [Phytophthora cactorum]KAG2920405.1 hypothetical protein PC114_g6099 [Phytophthora cactorum]KAG2933946.1 hypothetical protein PC115_g5311 [Phytophthora cactorum]